jgi:hypothetical protein
MLSRIAVGQTAEIRSESLADTVLMAEVSRVSPLGANHGLERVRGWTARRLGRDSSMPEPVN